MTKYTPKNPTGTFRRSEAGNVFFALFGAVAIVGVLGAGIMATMRGPLTTMVEVNRIEETKSVLRLNARLVLRGADINTCDADAHTEAADPETCASTATTAGGCIPANLGATLTDPWGTPYAYCAWNHGLENNACGNNVLAGENGTTRLAIALLSAGPDRQFTTTCADLYGLSNNDARGDDIAQRVEYSDAAAVAGGGTGGLWTEVDADTAGIDRNLEVTSTATSTFAGGAQFGNNISLTGTAVVDAPGIITDEIVGKTAGALTITADTTIAGDLIVAAGNNVTLNSPTTVDNTLDVTGNLTGGADDTLTIDDSLAVTGATDLQGALNVNGAIANDNGTDPVTIADSLSVDGAAILNSTLTINSDGTTSATDAIVVNNATPAEILALDDAGNLEIAGAIRANGGIADPLTTAGNIMVSNGTNFVSIDMDGDVHIDGDGDTLIQNEAVTYAKIQNINTNILLGRTSAGAGIIEELGLGLGLTFAGTNLAINTTGAGDEDCLKYDADTSSLGWGDCYTTGGGGDGVGTAGIGALSDVTITTATDQDCLVFDTSVDPDAWVNVPCSTIAGQADRIQDSTDPTPDTHIDVDTDGTGNVNSIVFTNNGAETMRIASGGGVSIGSGADAAASAILDISSTTRGLLPPRMDTAQRNAIGSPADGLIVYNTQTKTYDFYDGNATAWTSFATSAGAIAELNDIGDVDVAGATAGNIIKFDGTNWVLSDDLGGDLMFSGNLQFTGGSYSAWTQTGNASANLSSNSWGNGMTALNATTIAYLDEDNDELKTFSWDGADWAQVGNALSLTVSGSIYITALDGTSIAMVNNGTIRRYSWDGTNWAQVGANTNMATYFQTYAATLNSTTIAVRMGNELRTFVWNGTNWVLTGNQLGLGNNYNGTITALDSSTVAVTLDNADQIVTYSWDGSNWAQVGNAGALGFNTVNDNILALSSTIVLVANEAAGARTIATYRWDGTDWTQFGINHTTLNFAPYPPLARLSENTFVISDDSPSVLRTMSRVVGVSTIADADAGGTLGSLVSVGDRIRISLSSSNDGIYNVTAIDDVNTIVVRETLSTAGPEAAQISLIDSATMLASLVDIDVSSAVDGNCLVYNSGDGVWESGDCDAAGNTSEWTDDGSGNIYNTDGGYVGIGTGGTPESNLHVESVNETTVKIEDTGPDQHRAPTLLLKSSGYTGAGYPIGSIIFTTQGDDTADALIVGRKDVDNSSVDIEFRVGDLTTPSIVMEGDTQNIGIKKTPDAGVELDVLGDIQYTGTITDASDIRLKTDIKPLDSADMIARLAAVETYTFRMKDDTKGQIEYGVMAQEIEKIFPELVRTASDEMGTKSVNYIGLIAPMIAATKTLQTENEALKAELAHLQSAQTDLLEKVNGIALHTGYGQKRAGFDPWMLMALFVMAAATTVVFITRKNKA